MTATFDLLIYTMGILFCVLMIVMLGGGVLGFILFFWDFVQAVRKEGFFGRKDSESKEEH